MAAWTSYRLSSLGGAGGEISACQPAAERTLGPDKARASDHLSLTRCSLRSRHTTARLALARQVIYPLVATSFVLIPKYASSAEKRVPMMDFFRWVLEHGQAQAAALSYLPLPPSLVDRVKDYWDQQTRTAAR